MNLEKVTKLIKDYPDFPKLGIVFKDISPVLADFEARKWIVEDACKQIEELDKGLD